IVRPSAGTINPGHIIVLGAAVFFGMSMVMVKSMTRTESTIRIIFWMLIVQSVLGLVPAFYEWQNPPLALWPWIAVIAFTGMSSHLCLARALFYADATLIAPMDFLRVPLTALIGWLLYSEQIDMFVAAGAALILPGDMLALQRRGATPAEIATGGRPAPALSAGSGIRRQGTVADLRQSGRVRTGFLPLRGAKRRRTPPRIPACPAPSGRLRCRPARRPTRQWPATARRLR